MSDDWKQLDVEELEKAFTENTKGIIVNNPNNPTGKVTPTTTFLSAATLIER